jgi:signal transduction histidine kinase/ligand-binding sensor domain-containing protein
MKTKIPPIILSFILIGHSLLAQLNYNNLSHYNELDGTIIYDILPDHLGNIWLATQNGLVRYNGYEFRRFFSDPNDTTTISNILTFSLLEDKNNHIWVGSMDVINEYNPLTRSFRHYSIVHLIDFPKSSQPGVVSMVEDKRGRIYFGVTSATTAVISHALLYKDQDDPAIRTFEYPDSLKIQNVFNLSIDEHDNIRFISKNGLFTIDSSRKLSKLPPLPETTPDDISFNNVVKEDKNGKLWLSSNLFKVYTLDLANRNYQSHSLKGIFDYDLRQLTTTDIFIDPAGSVWIGSDQGLILYDPVNGKYETFDHSPEQKYSRSAINCLQMDNFGNLWIGTSANGLLRYNNRTVLHSITGNLGQDSPVTAGWAINLIETQDGKVWFITQGAGANYSGINEFDPEDRTITPRKYQTIIPGMDAIFAFTELKPGEFLMRTTEGLFCYYPENNTVQKTMIEGLPDSVRIFKFYSDKMENFWILTSEGIYRRVKGNTRLLYYDLSKFTGSSYSSNEVTNLFENQNNGLWFLTNEGLFLYDYTTDKIERHGYDKSKGDVFIAQDINSFYEGPDGIAWVGTWQGGLSRYNVSSGEIKTYTLSDGLPSMSIQGILPDTENNTLWLSTFEGLSKFNMGDQSFSNFSIDDGIQGPLFSEGSYLRTSSGLIIFGGSNGITFFDPGEINKNSIPPEIYISDFKIAGVSLAYGENAALQDAIQKSGEIHLKYRQNNISISYTGIHYSNPSKNKYAYKLENYDDNWREVGSQRTAYYYNLPSGDYIFRVKAANNNGIWNETGATLSISITPPIWRTWWAYTLYFLFILYMVRTVDRMQKRRIFRRERARAREKELAHAREIEKAYRELKSTQSQLIQAEKMASLGELTAGIAHEIQNPLNFVNNFSEVSSELVNEMKQELSAGSWQSATEIADDIKQNLEKINYHGKRAGDIVKGMLQHSRTSTGQKELTDINALADEYLRLAYHGLRAKDKSFNADFKTDFDPGLPKISVIPQDIGRVLLNLINNAFYAVFERNKKGESGYVPTVSITTKPTANGQVLIAVKDNGNGIPEQIKDKIFQPFFTTKPTGQGTGLGLSLSYDIVKAHGGELKVETKEGDGTVFRINLPIT